MAILTVISQLYPRYRWETSEEMVAVWTEMLSDIDGREAMLAVKRHAAISKFPPTIAEIREAVVANRRPDELTAGQAWGKIVTAIRRYGPYRSGEAREWLGESLWSMMRQIGSWSDLCETDRLEVLGAQFERRYNAMQDRMREKLLVPQHVQAEARAMLEGKRRDAQALADGLAAHMAIEGGEPR